MQRAFFNTKIKRIIILAGTFFIALAVYTPRASAAGVDAVKITEFMANPSVVSDTNGEWIEVKNQTSTAVNLTGWDIDGSTITTASGGFVLERKASAVICKNIVRAQNDGVVCDASSGFSLGNTSDTISLRDETNTVIDSVSYAENTIQGGKSNHVPGLSSESSRKYSVNNFGQPAHNQTTPPVANGTIYVSHAIDFNQNTWPDFAGGEPHHKGRVVRLYAVNGSTWTLKGSVTTKSTTYAATAKFVAEPDSYALCEISVPGFSQSFSRTIVGWYHAPEVGVTNNSGASDEYSKCIPVNVSANEPSSHVFGDYPIVK